MDRIMASDQQGSQAHWGIGFLVLVVLGLSTGSAFGQATNEITTVDPNSATLAAVCGEGDR